MSEHLICDYCNERIEAGETYYTVRRHDKIGGDTINDICCECARKLSVNLYYKYDGIGLLKIRSEDTE